MCLRKHSEELILVNRLLVCFAENYFRGQGITLNERFRNEQYYSLQDEFKEEEDEEVEMGNVRPVMNRYTCQLFWFYSLVRLAKVSKGVDLSLHCL